MQPLTGFAALRLTGGMNRRMSILTALDPHRSAAGPVAVPALATTTLITVTTGPVRPVVPV